MELKGEYLNLGVNPVRLSYTFLIEDIQVVAEGSEIIKVEGKHIENRSNEDVGSVWGEEENIENFPAALNIFESLKHIRS